MRTEETYLIYIMGYGGHTDGCNLLRTSSFTKLLRVIAGVWDLTGGVQLDALPPGT